MGGKNEKYVNTQEDYLEKPVKKEAIPLQFSSNRSGKMALSLKSINISYPNKIIMKSSPKFGVFFQRKTSFIIREIVFILI